MKVELSIGCRLEEADKKRIQRAFRESNLSLAGCVADFLLKKAAELETPTMGGYGIHHSGGGGKIGCVPADSVLWEGIEDTREK